jgi:Family of unknown function (DUF5996)
MRDPNIESPARTEAMRDDAIGATVAIGATEGGNIEEVWPSLPYEEWKDTYETVHMWTQTVYTIDIYGIAALIEKSRSGQ